MVELPEEQHVSQPYEAVPDRPIPGDGPLPTGLPPYISPSSTRLWTFGDLGLFLLFALVTMVVAGGTVVGTFSALNKILGWGMSMDQTSVQTPIAVLVQMLWEFLWVVFIYYIVVEKYRLDFWKGLKWNPTIPRAANYLFGGFVLSVVIQLLSQLFPKSSEMPIEKLFDTPSSAYLLAFFGICVAPFMEELVFRGFFYPVIERRWGALAIHAQQVGGVGPELLAILVVGLTLSAVRAITGSVKPSFLMHLGYNSTLFILLFVSTNRFQTLSP
jgi:membrane protease YdiL (CAAX protease family)